MLCTCFLSKQTTAPLTDSGHPFCRVMLRGMVMAGTMAGMMTWRTLISWG